MPQGAPTSPALANRCFYKVDRSIAAYCRAAGVTYTRYADDLTFSSSHGCCGCDLGSDDFNRADSTDVGSKWEELSGGWEIDTNELVNVAR